jgi:YVTN family beta-propeller protein
MVKTKRSNRAFCLAAATVLALLQFFSDAVFGTRLPKDFAVAVSTQFPGSHPRLDGSIETKKGDLFLPVVPNGKKTNPGTVNLNLTIPDANSPDLLSFSNGWFYLRVIRRGLLRTTILPKDVPEATRKMLLTCHFPTDLIVPDSFVLPRSFKPLLGDTSIPLTDDAVIARADFGQAQHKSKNSHAKGAIFVTSPCVGKITYLDESNFKKLIEFPTEGTPSGMAYAQGKLYIADQTKNRILVLDPNKKQFLGQIDLLKHSAPKGLAALPNGQLIYASESGTNDIAVIETATGKPLLRTKVAAGPSKITITPNGNVLLILNVPSGELTMLSTMNQKVIGVVKVGAMPNAITVSKNNQIAYVSNRMSNTVSVVDIIKHLAITTLPTGVGPTGIALNDDDTLLFVANAKDNTISVYNALTYKKLQDIKLPMDIDFPGALDLMPDGKRLIVSSESTEAIGILDTSKLEFTSQPVIGYPTDDIIWIPVD